MSIARLPYSIPQSKSNRPGSSRSTPARHDGERVCRPHPVTSTQTLYSSEDSEFLAAIQRFQKASGRKFLLHTDYLDVFKSLGFVRVATTTGGDPS